MLTLSRGAGKPRPPHGTSGPSTMTELAAPLRHHGALVGGDWTTLTIPPPAAEWYLSLGGPFGGDIPLIRSSLLFAVLGGGVRGVVGV